MALAVIRTFLREISCVRLMGEREREQVTTGEKIDAGRGLIRTL